MGSPIFSREPNFPFYRKGSNKYSSACRETGTTFLPTDLVDNLIRAGTDSHEQAFLGTLVDALADVRRTSCGRLTDVRALSHGGHGKVTKTPWR